MTTSDRIPLPDEGQWFTIRKLTGRQHEEAQAAHRSAFADGNTNGWAVVFRRALQHGAKDAAVLKALADPLTGYDRYTLIRLGLVAWSYERPIKDAADDLDDETVDYIAREVLRLTKPALFQTIDEAETARKNATGAFTAV